MDKKKKLLLGGLALGGVVAAILVSNKATAGVQGTPGGGTGPQPGPTPGTPPKCDPNASYWTSVTDSATVGADSMEPNYVALLNDNSQPVGSVKYFTVNGHVWMLRVTSAATDPGITTYVRDVHGWIANVTDCTP